MAKDRFLIVPFQSGLENDVKPFLIPEDAFSRLENAYVWRGRVKKRFGSSLLRGSGGATQGFEQVKSRLRIQIASIVGSPSGPIALPAGIGQLKIGQMFSVNVPVIGEVLLTVHQLGLNVPTLTTNPAVTAIINNTVSPNTIDVTGAIGGTLYYYPANPVMGFTNYESEVINQEQTIAFDTQFAYQYVGTGWERLGTASWTGSNSDFFWSTNWRGNASSSYLLFTTNNKTGSTLNDSDPIQYWDGAVWASLNPAFSSTVATNTIRTARIILPFKDRLILLNVTENTGVAPGTNTTYVNRCRYSQNGSPLSADAWYEDVAGKGGYIDAPTREAIVTAQYLKDRLIVYFERSTWELVYTRNQVLPFTWQKINTELGAESTFSQVPFDKVVIGVGNVGIHATNGVNVERIDEKIPDEVFNIYNDDDGVKRVGGIRDYKTEMVYWTFPDTNSSSLTPFPNKVLTFNYKTKSWGLNDDSITAFGYHQIIESSLWGEVDTPWEEYNVRWGSGVLNAQSRLIIGGNQEGFTFLIDSSIERNSPSLQVTNTTFIGDVLQCVVQNHNLQDGDFILLENMNGLTNISDVIRKVTVVDSNNFTVPAKDSTGTYTGGGTISRVSRIDILTKQFNFYLREGRTAAIEQVDFMVKKTEFGQATIDQWVSSSTLSLVDEGKATGTLVGTSILETFPYPTIPLEQQQDRLWHSINSWAEGEAVQLRIYLTDEQMQNVNIALEDFEMHGMIIHASKSQFIGPI